MSGEFDCLVWCWSHVCEVQPVCHNGAPRYHMNEDSELHDLHFRYYHWLIQEFTEWIQQGKDREEFVRFNWPSPERLETLEIYEIVWKAPKEMFLEVALYKEKHGDPNENARGDVVTKGPDGQMMVKLKQTHDLWSREKRFVNQQVKRRVLDDGTDPMSGKFIEQRWRNCSSTRRVNVQVMPFRKITNHILHQFHVQWRF